MTLPLVAGQAIALNNVTSANLFWAMWGCEIVNGVPQYKALAEGSPLSAVGAWQNIYVVPTGRSALVTQLMIMQYPTAGVQQIYVGTGSNGYLANPIYIPSGGYVTWDDGGWHYHDSNGRRIT
jgi:hypothetical protein